MGRGSFLKVGIFLRLDQFADEYDQLRQSVKKKEAFIEFNEGEITFLPSYKILVHKLKNISMKIY